MSRINYEDISAFMDGELDDRTDEVIDHLITDVATRGTWMRYHLINQAVKQSLPSHLDPRLSTTISEKLREEATVLRPAREKLMSYLKPAAGLAIAASVASVAILSVQQQRQETIPDPADNPVMASSQPGVPLERQMQNPAARPASIDNMRSSPDNHRAAVERVRRSGPNSRLNSYLINYNEYHANAGMQGMLPYARIVAHDRYE